MDTKAEFLGCIEKDVETGCWNWCGGIHKSTGYSRLRWKGRDTHGHRVSYRLFIGRIPQGLQIDHLCRNRRCVNPDHLEAVTRRVNILRGNAAPAINARRTHCKSGHEFTPENTGREFDRKTGAPKRYCKECKRIRAREFYRSRKAARTTKRRNGGGPKLAGRRE